MAGSSPAWGAVKINPKPCLFAAQVPELASLGGTECILQWGSCAAVTALGARSRIAGNAFVLI